MLKTEAQDACYEVINIFGYYGLVTTMIIDRDTLPYGIYAYDLRDDDYGAICEIKDSVPYKNFWGTLLLMKEIDGTDAGRCVNEDDYYFTGRQIKLSQFLGEF